ncbi:MAG: MauE/DoxX family redox-associated membrane protein [Pseudomonadota bacterium]
MSVAVYSLATLTACWLLAAVFGLAVWHKLRAWPRFLAVLEAYRIVPAGLLVPAAALVVLAELATVALLVLATPAGAAAAAGLLGIYLVAMVVNMARGRRLIDCGCGDTPTPLPAYLLARNVALMALCAWPLFGPQRLLQLGPETTTLELTWGLSLCAAAMASLGVLLYLSAEQLLANHGIYQRLWAAEGVGEGESWN